MPSKDTVEQRRKNALSEVFSWAAKAKKARLQKREIRTGIAVAEHKLRKTIEKNREKNLKRVAAAKEKVRQALLPPEPPAPLDTTLDKPERRIEV
jgi:hypothetical protein